MPNNPALAATITDEQRQNALEGIEQIREQIVQFAENAEQAITTNSSLDVDVLRPLVGTGSHLHTSMTWILKALWIIEEAAHAQRLAEIAAMGKEGNQ